MKHLLTSIFLAVVMAYWAIPAGATSGIGERNYFQFAIPEYHTTRQSGQVVTINVRYVYKKDLPERDYPDYRILRSQILKHMEPSEALPMNTFWEILATRMGRELMRDFPLDGVSVQLTVLDNQNQVGNEPSDHGPIFTMGDIGPWDSGQTHE